MIIHSMYIAGHLPLFIKQPDRGAGNDEVGRDADSCECVAGDVPKRIVQVMFGIGEWICRWRHSPISSSPIDWIQGKNNDRVRKSMKTIVWSGRPWGKYGESGREKLRRKVHVGVP